MSADSGDSGDGGEEMYDEAIARKMLVEARHERGDVNGNAFVGFSATDVDKECAVRHKFGSNSMTAMIYFARRGDLKMCRYLVSRGASTTKRSTTYDQSRVWDDVGETWWPMYTAANAGHLDICEFLYAHGAKDDIRKADRDGWTPFIEVATRKPDEMRSRLMRWLVLNGALCADGNSTVIQILRIEKITHPITKKKRKNAYLSLKNLLNWAEEVIQNHSSMLTFLLGMLPPSDKKSEYYCILQYLEGHPGLRKHIAVFVGLECMKAKYVRMLRHLTQVLPPFMKKVQSLQNSICSSQGSQYYLPS